MRSRAAVGVVTAAGISALLALPAQAAETAATTELVTQTASGAAPTGNAKNPAVSADGRYVAFASTDSGLTSDPDAGDWDVFVRDTKTGVTKKISVGLNGARPNGGSYDVDISADGRYVAFSSDATNLLPGDSTPSLSPRIFVKDLQTGKLANISAVAEATGYGGESEPSISADGGVVAFSSSRDNLVPGDTNKVGDVFVWKRETGELTRVSVSSSGEQAPYGSYNSALEPDLSGDGKWVAFRSGAANLVPGDTNGISDVFLHSLETSETTRVSVGPNGEQATGGVTPIKYGTGSPSLSHDASVIAYDGSSVAGIVEGEPGYNRQIYVRDRVTGATELANVTLTGERSTEHGSQPALSPDGRFVGFMSYDKNLVEGDTDEEDVFVRDLANDRTARASVAADGSQANNSSGIWGIALSEGARTVAFTSLATNLVPDSVGGNHQLFQHRFAGGFWNAQ
ncbi:TolB family protein [Kineosporia babensis]|uniref:WD40 repeat protein n=1 Tax=Kineosporia babensis TaxID=499548 RepID=A0A9X1N707_9ACTN|nr:hypothetical protein [Kineosporia babensis]MCD5309532.1 hypothetical protein [Kineosporia babensis]